MAEPTKHETISQYPIECTVENFSRRPNVDKMLESTKSQREFTVWAYKIHIRISQQISQTFPFDLLSISRLFIFEIKNNQTCVVDLKTESTNLQ